MATLRRSPYAVINIWCPYGYIAKIALYRYKYLMTIWQHCEDCLIPLYIFDVHMVTLRRSPYAVINIWCPYGYIAKIALYRYKYLMSIWQHCEDSPYTIIIWCPYVNIAKIALCRYKYVHMATLRRSPYTVINSWCPYGNIAKIALYRYKYLMSIWQHCEDCPL